MLRWIDGFDHALAASDVSAKWGTGNGSLALVTGRNGGQAWSSSGPLAYVKRTFDNQQYWYVGFAYYRTNVTQGQCLLTFSDGSTGQLFLIIKNAGTSLLAFGSSAVSNLTSTGGETALAVNTWYYVEVKVKITNSVAAGDCQIYLNGTLYTSLAAGQNARQGTTNNYANTIFLGQSQNYSTSATYFDDLYVCDSQGTANNALLGPCYVSTIKPSAAGASTQWTPHASTNVSQINETKNDGDTTYNSTAGTGNRDSFTLASLTDNPLHIYGAQSVSAHRIDAAETTRTVNNSIRSGGSYSDGTASGNLTSTYSWVTDRWETDPNTSAAWTKSGLTNAEAGVKLVS